MRKDRARIVGNHFWTSLLRLKSGFLAPRQETRSQHSPGRPPSQGPLPEGGYKSLGLREPQKSRGRERKFQSMTGSIGFIDSIFQISLLRSTRSLCGSVAEMNGN